MLSLSRRNAWITRSPAMLSCMQALTALTRSLASR